MSQCTNIYYETSADNLYRLLSMLPLEPFQLYAYLRNESDITWRCTLSAFVINLRYWLVYYLIIQLISVMPERLDGKK